MGERQAYCKHLTKDLNALLVSGEQKEHRGCLCRQNVLKDFPRQRAGSNTESSTLGHCTCTCGLQGISHFGSELMDRGVSSAWTARTWMCRRPAQASAHNLLTHAGREWSQQSHKSLVCFLHPWPLQRPLFSVLSLPFLKKAPYYPGKSCGFALISILSVFSCFQAWPNIVVIHFHRLKQCLDYLKNPNKQQANKIPQTKQAPNPTNTTPMTTIQNTTQGWRKCIPFLCQDAITTPFSVDQKTEPVHIIGPHYHTPRTSGQ